jgi:hypothetical protein
MRNFRVTDGDLDITTSRRADMVMGRDKLVQDLTLWLLEPLGTGFTTPGFGSTLNTVVARDSVGRQQGRFIGRSMNDQMVADVEAEIDRILSLYQQNQIQTIRQAQIQGRLYLYSRQEILNSIDNITTTIDLDRVIVRAAITTGANQELTFLAQVDENGSDIAT